MDDIVKLMAEEKNSRMQGLSLAISGYGLAAIRGIFILNGSAAITVLTKQPVITPSGKWIILLCAVGAMFAVLCSSAGFLAQWYKQKSFMNASDQSLYSYQRTGIPQVFTTIDGFFQGDRWFWTAAGFYCISVCCFIFSSFLFLYYF